MHIKKGVILAGGRGTRLYPMSQPCNKHFFPLYDKPMIYYPLTTLMLMGIREIHIVTNPSDLPIMAALLQDGQQWGLSITYQPQDQPKGLTHAFLQAEAFVGTDPCALILGDNIFYGPNLSYTLQQSMSLMRGAMVVGCYVTDPTGYAVAAFDTQNTLVDIIEKPVHPTSNVAITGLYLYDGTAMERAKRLSPSKRGEYEITDLNCQYLKEGNLDLLTLPRGFAWFDAGTPESFLQTSEFVHTLDQRQGFKIGCPEEVAYRRGFITAAAFEHLLFQMPASHYRTYLRNILQAGTLLEKQEVGCTQY